MNPSQRTYGHLMTMLYFTLILLFAGSVLTGSSGCAGKKKAGKTQKVTTVHDDPDQLLKAKGQLLEILNDNGSIPLSEKEATLEEIKAQQFQDTEINSMIDLAEQKIRSEKEKARKIEPVIPPQDEGEAEVTSTADVLEGFFDDLVNNKNYSASNIFINQALKMFVNESVPVLIIISQEGGMTDYDEPTTILKYLQYLDDTKNNVNRISNIVLNQEGLITELELIKK
ncbi:MAG: hypothetical protein PHD61_12065 [Bacteroidales bacterium]|nr:hypothetical protein [Lentimicrobiaceae bacterium]MDD5696024.1 hypothetical protein [Bacteroidales bacterium]